MSYYYGPYAPSYYHYDPVYRYGDRYGYPAYAYDRYYDYPSSHYYPRSSYYYGPYAPSYYDSASYRA
jgi:hypothetical protein